MAQHLAAREKAHGKMFERIHKSIEKDKLIGHKQDMGEAEKYWREKLKGFGRANEIALGASAAGGYAEQKR